MAIVSSSIKTRSAQLSGMYVTELHIDQNGNEFEITYLNTGQDEIAVMTARATLMWPEIVERDCHRIIIGDLLPSFLKSASINDLVTYARNAYKEKIGEELVPIARWIINRYQDGTFTAQQIANAFGITLAQLNALNVKMQTLISNYDAVQSAVGE